MLALVSRPGLPEKCPEILIIPQLLHTIWNFPKNVKPSLLEHLQANSQNKTICILKDCTDIETILSKIKKM